MERFVKKKLAGVQEKTEVRSQMLEVGKRLKMARSFGRRSFLLPVPVGLMTFAAGLLGKKDVADRLFGSLQVDSSKARDLLGWTPVVSMDEGLRGMEDGKREKGEGRREFVAKMKKQLRG